MTEQLVRETFEATRLREAAVAALASVDETPTELRPIHRGNRKQTAIASFEARGPVVVQVCSERRWLRTEATLLREIRQRTFVPVPPVLAAGTHDGVAYLLTAYVAGRDLHEQFIAVSDETRHKLVRWFGKALARLHDAFEFDAYGRLAISGGTLTADRTDWGEWFREFGQRAVDRLPSSFDPLRRDLEELVARSSLDPAPSARLFPWDFRPGNALIANEAVTAVLDWEAPIAAQPALSVAKSEYLVADWYVDEARPLRRAFRDGYTDVRELPAVRPVHRVAAIAESAVDSSGAVTNPRYPPVDRDDAVTFHREALEAELSASRER